VPTRKHVRPQDARKDRADRRSPTERNSPERGCRSSTCKAPREDHTSCDAGERPPREHDGAVRPKRFEAEVRWSHRVRRRILSFRSSESDSAAGGQSARGERWGRGGGVDGKRARVGDGLVENGEMGGREGAPEAADATAHGDSADGEWGVRALWRNTARFPRKTPSHLWENGSGSLGRGMAANCTQSIDKDENKGKYVWGIVHDHYWISSHADLWCVILDNTIYTMVAIRKWSAKSRC
jgi:hypothetical protein